MNEIITKLDEIEGKADAIIADAVSRKEQLAAQLEKDKLDVDAQYDALEKEAAANLEHELRAKAEQQILARKQQNKEALAHLEQEFAEKKDCFADEILGRIVQV